MENNKATIIITTYKGEDSIVKAVESCINQTYKNLEIIVVDDNGRGSLSQKNTEALLNNYIKNKQIKYIPHEVNSNASVARNTGVKNAQGKYIALLDDDDYFFENKIQKQVEAFENLDEEFGIVYCGMLDDMDGLIYEYKATYAGDVLYDFGMTNVSACTSNIMFRKSDFIELGGFDESFRRHQDWEFLIRMANKKKFYSIDYIGTQKNTKNVLRKINLENAEQYRLKYINLIKNEIFRLPQKLQNNILAHEYNEIAKLFFRNKKIKKTIKYIFLGKRPDWFIRDFLIKPFRTINIKLRNKNNGKIIVKK